jgi:predicted kinase
MRRVLSMKPIYKCKCCGPKEKRVTTVTMTKGLPGSGKSFWAKAQVLVAQPGTVVRVNKDDLRAMLHADRWSPANEKQVVRARDALIEAFLIKKVNHIIVDDTNFAPGHETRLRQLAERHGAQFKVQDFTDVPLHTCIKRDLKRDRSVGKDVIVKMYDQYLRPTPQSPPEYLIGLPDAVLVDIDGTLAKMSDRSPFEWDRVGEDTPHSDVIDLVIALREAGSGIVFVSGRDGSSYDLTRQWLVAHVGPWAATQSLFMRAAGDMRKDSVVKKEIYEERILGRYNVWFVLDDRDQVVERWRDDLGLRCLQVAPGNF